VSRSRCYRPPRSIAAPSSLRTSCGPSNRKSNRSSARTTVPRRCNRGWRGSAAESPADTIDPNGRVRRRDSRRSASSTRRTRQRAGATREPGRPFQDNLPRLRSSATGRNPRQRFWLVFGASAPIRFAAGCHRLQPRGSTKASSFVYKRGDQRNRADEQDPAEGERARAGEDADVAA
jgi:hypothetical protein